jgi:hypothetical protein
MGKAMKVRAKLGVCYGVELTREQARRFHERFVALLARAGCKVDKDDSGKELARMASWYLGWPEAAMHGHGADDFEGDARWYSKSNDEGGVEAYAVGICGVSEDDALMDAETRLALDETWRESFEPVLCSLGLAWKPRWRHAAQLAFG